MSPPVNPASRGSPLLPASDFQLPYVCPLRSPLHGALTVIARSALRSSASAVPPRPGRTVRAVMLRVTVLALAVDRVDRLRIARIARMSDHIGVALLAQSRPRNLEQEV